MDSLPATLRSVTPVNNNGVKPLSFEGALTRFVENVQARFDAYRARNCPNNSRNVVTVVKGRRYVRLFVGVSNDLSRSCHCFVDTTNGDILKPDSYKKPAPRARGNIYDAPAVIDPRVLPHY
jgi:hypothetical protein